MRLDIKNTNRIPYRQIQTFDAWIGGQSIRIVGRPAFNHWNEVTPATVLLAESLQLRPEMRILHFGLGSGGLSVVLARQVTPENLWLVDTHILAYRLTQSTLRENGLTAHFHGESDLPDEQIGSFDLAVIELPKGRKLAQRWFLQARQALRDGGVLYLAGSNKGGIQSAIKDAEALFGTSSILGYKKGNRVVSFLKTQKSEDLPAWASVPGIAPRTWHELDVRIGDRRFQLYTLPGVFSYDKLDAGTAFLLDELPVSLSGCTLDLGCGYGLLGLVASQLSEWVDLVDANLLAVAATRRNLKANSIPNASVFAGDVTGELELLTYQFVITNPPFHSSHSVDYVVALAFIEEAHQVLIPGGELWLVANRFIRYNPILETFYRRVDIVAVNNHYQVLRAVK